MASKASPNWSFWSPVLLSGEAVRPRSFELVDNNSSDNLSGKIDLIENMGSEILVHIKINEFTFRSVQSRSYKLNIGDTINLKPKKGQVHLFNKDGKVIRNE